jgi:hypothetical protein
MLNIHRGKEGESIFWKLSFFDLVVGQNTALTCLPVSEQLARSLNFEILFSVLRCFIVIQPMGILLPG